MAEVFATLLLGLGVGLFIGLLFSNERVKRNKQILSKYFRFKKEEESFRDVQSSSGDEDEVSQY